MLKIMCMHNKVSKRFHAINVVYNYNKCFSMVSLCIFMVTCANVLLATLAMPSLKCKSSKFFTTYCNCAPKSLCLISNFTLKPSNEVI